MRIAALPFVALALAAPLSAQRAESDARTYLDRIAAIDDAGPQLNAVIAVNPDAPHEAAEAEAQGLPLAGRTVLVKDNIETRELPTTAGSLALANNMTGRDAPLIARMREAGGVVLGKTNLSEWANIRDTNSTSGWSAVGGLTRNPHAIDRNTCGSSSGSGAAVAANLTWAAIGTETDGSITCPASVNGIVGFKPTVGLVSRTHVVPISHSQDTAGPMARSVADAALLLNAIAGSDPADSATADTDSRLTDFTAGLATASLAGVRIGVLVNAIGNRTDVRKVFEVALADLRLAGAEIVEIDAKEPEGMGAAEFTVLLYELHTDMAAYLATLPGEDTPRDLADLIAFNLENANSELRWFGQSLFEAALETEDEGTYREARAKSLRLAGEEGIDRLLEQYDVEVLVAPTRGPAWTSDLLNGDNYNGSIGAGSLAAIAGYPHLTVPMGAVERLPVGISFMGGKWADHRMLQLGAAYERARTVAIPEPSLRRWSPDG
ncbi:amidase [Qipengyuania qiaonensis]|uniref:Amidase n=1 Tax=Qipengyuania qiaonensis TaxID=2867240 RepID=A0ABS7J777_9SPHN|nr:amidase [Qipengyuania qiaonensis]MBX7483173.1 amidase [Qipengyuania qiaonensis]